MSNPITQSGIRLGLRLANQDTDVAYRFHVSHDVL